ncbi:hypothetical protein FACS1894200_03020 [Spirochaetia bacterium]|nr:hypothetical protein FACS1894200_03020 [Spirochaetia bacterium]
MLVKLYAYGYHMWEMEMSDYTTAINTAIEKGEAKREARDIRNLLDFGMSLQQVSVALKVPLSMVTNIQEEAYTGGE